MAAATPNRKSGGCPASSAAWTLLQRLTVRGSDELDLLAGLLLEGGDDLRDRPVLLGIKPFSHHTTRSAARAPSGAMTSATQQ